MTVDEPAIERRVITVRMPAKLHAQLTNEAWRRRQSVNSLCLDLLGVPFHGGKIAMDNSPGNPTPCSPVSQIHPDAIRIPE